MKTAIQYGSLGNCKASMIKWISTPAQFKHHCHIQHFTRGINGRNVMKTMMIKLTGWIVSNYQQKHIYAADALTEPAADIRLPWSTLNIDMFRYIHATGTKLSLTQILSSFFSILFCLQDHFKRFPNVSFGNLPNQVFYP